MAGGNHRLPGHIDLNYGDIMVRAPLSLKSPDPNMIERDGSGRSVGYFCKQLPVKVDDQLLEELRAVAMEEGKNVRLCLHDSPEALQHDMIVLEHARYYYRPHRHFKKMDVFHVMDGELGVLLFDEAGNVESTDRLGAGEVYRIGLNIYHAVMPLSDYVIYHENKPGPFEPSGDDEYPTWAPDGNDAKLAAAYSVELRQHFRR